MNRSIGLCIIKRVTNDLSNLLTARRALAKIMHSSVFKMIERRRTLEESLAHLVTRSQESIMYRRRLSAQLDDQLSTDHGLLRLYRIYLLDGGGNIILREADNHASNDAAAVRLGWLLFDTRKTEQPAAGGIEIWRGRRRVFSRSCEPEPLHRYAAE